MHGQDANDFCLVAHRDHEHFVTVGFAQENGSAFAAGLCQFLEHHAIQVEK